jgi:hypothetical protein
VNRQPTADAIGTHERASATPVRAEIQHPLRHGSAPQWDNIGLSLRSQQEWFAAIVTMPESQPAPVDAASAARLVTPSATLSALERLEIYRRSYHARLIECLADDYPVLEHALGEEAFESLCRGYIAHHPSTGPNLNVFGCHMPEFCRTEPVPAPGFAADLAALEWAVVLAIHAATAAPLTLDDLSKVPGERWPEARLVANPSLRILHLDYPANAYLQDYRKGATPSIPSPHETWVAVYRTGRNVWRMELQHPMVVLVQSLMGGATLAVSLSRVEPLLETHVGTDPASMVRNWFRHGISSGLFSQVIVD